MDRVFKLVLAVVAILMLTALFYVGRFLYVGARKNIENKPVSVSPDNLTKKVEPKKEVALPPEQKAATEKFLQQIFLRPVPVVLEETVVEEQSLPQRYKFLLSIADLEPMINKRMTSVNFKEGGTGYKLSFEKEMVDDLPKFTYFLRRKLEAKDRNEYFVNSNYITTAAALEFQHKNIEGMYIIYETAAGEEHKISGYVLFW